MSRHLERLIARTTQELPTIVPLVSSRHATRSVASAPDELVETIGAERELVRKEEPPRSVAADTRALPRALGPSLGEPVEREDDAPIDARAPEREPVRARVDPDVGAPSLPIIPVLELDAPERSEPLPSPPSRRTRPEPALPTHVRPHEAAAPSAAPAPRPSDRREASSHAPSSPAAPSSPPAIEARTDEPAPGAETSAPPRPRAAKTEARVLPPREPSTPDPERASAPSVVHVHIGRIDVRATTPKAPPSAAPSAPRAASSMSLAQYLSRRSQER